jgi:hypothetical protein
LLPASYACAKYVNKNKGKFEMNNHLAKKLCIIGLSFTFAACSSIKQTNANLFESIDQIENSVNALQGGMNIDEVASSLGVSNRHFYKLDRADLLRAKYGAEPRITVDSRSLASVGDELSRIEGYKISYKDIKSSWAFVDFGARMKRYVVGEEMDVVLLFKDKKFTESIVSGGRVNDSSRDSNIPEPRDILKLR